MSDKQAKIFLISCSKTKEGTRTQARKLYRSPLFQMSLRFAEKQQPTAIYILSAKHGLLEPSQEILPYNLILGQLTKRQQEEWAGQVIQKLRWRHSLEKDEFVFLSGSLYYRNLLASLPNHQLPLAGLGIGKRLRFLKESLS